jgi:hypothetical protein
LTFSFYAVIFNQKIGEKVMPERDPLDLIKNQLSRTEEIAGLHADHENFKHWYSETKMILEKIFGSKSIHYQNFLALRFREMSVKAFASAEIDKINTTRYKKDLEHARNILQSTAKELTLDRTLFKKIQTTPKTVEVSLRGEYFISSGIEEPDLIQAVKNAFEGSGLSPISEIETSEQGGSLRQWIDQIKRAKFGIYELSTLEKTNTLLEIGAALGMGKEVIIIYKKGSSLPETMESLNRVEYEDFSDLTEKLRKKVAS